MVTVRYFAAARAPAGVVEEKAPGGTLGSLLTHLEDEHGPDLAKVLGAASFLVNGLSWREREATLPDDATVDILPPFAGG